MPGIINSMLASYPASMRVMMPLGHHIRTETGNFARICSISASYQNKSVQVNNKLSRLIMVADPKQRILGSMPLTALWNHDGDLDAERIRDLGVDDIKSMLRQGAVQFVVANVGSPLDWIHPDLSFDFWRKIVKQRIVPTDTDGFSLDDYPDGYCYCASLWMIQESDNIIVLETHH